MYANAYLLSKICRADSPAITESENSKRRNLETDRQSDAMTVQRAFANTKKVY